MGQSRYDYIDDISMGTLARKSASINGRTPLNGGAAFQSQSQTLADSQANLAWDALGLDPTMYSSNNYATRKGFQMSGADLQSAYVNQSLAERSAQLEHDLNLDIYNQTQSFQAQKDQMLEAGFNPALMMNGGMSGGADGVSVDSGDSTTGAAQMAAVDAQRNSTMADTALGAFRQAMSIPMLSEEVRGAKIQNDLNEDMSEYYKRGIIADTERKEYEARRAAVDVTLAEMTKDNKIELSNLEVVAKKNDIDIQEFEKIAHEYQNKMLELDSQYKEQFIQLNISMQACQMALMQSSITVNKETVKKIVAEVGRIKAETIKLGKECNLLDQEIGDHDQKMFLAYMDVFNNYINSMSNKAHAGIMASAKGMGMNAGGEVERLDGAYGSALQTILDQFGQKGVYTSFTLPGGRWQGLSAPNSGSAVDNPWTKDLDPRFKKALAKEWDRAHYEEYYNYQKGRIKPEHLQYLNKKNPYKD